MNHVDYTMQAFNNFIQERELNVYNKTVLDVGCRDKVCKNSLESFGLQWTGIDPFPACEGVIKAYMEDMSGVPSESYDFIFACHSFEHCEHPIEALKEMYRIIKPGGYVFIATPMPCAHQILNADPDHIFVLIPMNFVRLMHYTNFREYSSTIFPGDIEQNHTIVSVGRKPL